MKKTSNIVIILLAAALVLVGYMFWKDQNTSTISIGDARLEIEH